MRIVLALVALVLTGCAHGPFMEPRHTAEIPCDKNNCGKKVVWEFNDTVPSLVQAQPVAEHP